MSYTAKAFNVMVASPGDVASERSIVRDVVYEWNAVHSARRSIVLLPIGWESHSSPEMGAKPQAIINNQVLDKCDLMVGVFWTRLGTETDEYSSGTVEEIERHVAAGKPAMLYFSSQPVAMDTADLDQVAKLKAFKESCKSKGLYEGYDSHADFRSKFYRHLQLKVNDHPLFNAHQASDNAEFVAEAASNLPTLTAEARVLLKEASLDPHGTILYVRYIGGTDIQTNGKNVIPSHDRRDVAKWEQALQDLVDSDLLVARGHKGEVFEVSNRGYQVAEMIAV